MGQQQQQEIQGGYSPKVVREEKKTMDDTNGRYRLRKNGRISKFSSFYLYMYFAVLPYVIGTYILIPCVLYYLSSILLSQYSLYIHILSTALLYLMASLTAYWWALSPVSNYDWDTDLSLLTQESIDKEIRQGDDLMDRIVKADAPFLAQTILSQPLRSLEIFRERVQDLERKGTLADFHLAALYREVLNQFDSIPDWVDFEAIKRAQSFYSYNITPVLDGLTVGLIESYGFPKDAQVLYLAGGLTTNPDITLKRLSQTSLFVLHVTSELPFQYSIVHNHILGVRVIHSLVSHRILKSGRWNVEKDGLPLNQANQLGTLFFFCHQPIECMRMHGFKVTVQDENDCWNLWRYTGYLLGLKLENIPESYHRGLMYRNTSFYLDSLKPDETSKNLTQSLLNAIEKTGLPIPIRFVKLRCYYMLGKEVAAGLGIEPPSTLTRVMWAWGNHSMRLSGLVNRYLFSPRIWFSELFLRRGIIPALVHNSGNGKLDFLQNSLQQLVEA